jgi:phage/plasmid-like protein (TIGR03299 family)
MPALFDQGFFVREPAWHGQGVVLDDYPSRDEAMRLAGHDWDVVTGPVFDGNGAEIQGFTLHKRSDNGFALHVARESFERIPNAMAYEVAEVLFDQGFQYETGITLANGRICAITLKLDQPFHVGGDNSVILPYGCLSWRHDGNGSLKARTGTIRQVCANTVSASEAQGAKLGTDFTFRHTKNVKERIADAKLAMAGLKDDIDAYKRMAEELAAQPVTPAQRDLFVSAIVGDRDYRVSKGVDVSARVKTNVETERAKVLGLFMADPAKTTIPEDHALTAYGLFLAGTEYFDHLRPYREQGSYVKRTLLKDSRAKASLRRTIAEVTA